MGRIHFWKLYTVFIDCLDFILENSMINFKEIISRKVFSSIDILIIFYENLFIHLILNLDIVLIYIKHEK